MSGAILPFVRAHCCRVPFLPPAGPSALWLTRGWLGWQGMHKGSGIGVMCEMLAGALGGGYTVRPGGLGEDEPSPRARPVSINSVVAFVRPYAPYAPGTVLLCVRSRPAFMLPADDLTHTVTECPGHTVTVTVILPLSVDPVPPARAGH